MGKSKYRLFSLDFMWPVLAFLSMFYVPTIETINTPFKIDRAGNVLTLDVTIDVVDNYSIDLVYIIPPGSVMKYSTLFDLAAGIKYNPDGTESWEGADVPFSIRIFKKYKEDEQLIHDKTVRRPALSRYSSTEFKSELLTVALDRGRYRIRLETLKDSPDFSKVETLIRFREYTHGK